MSKYAIDFDGVVCAREGIPTEGDFSKCIPVKDSQKALRWLIKQGHELYILTNRPKSDWKSMEEWMKTYNFPDIRITNIKELNTKAYIDDRSLRFTNWNDIRKLLE